MLSLNTSSDQRSQRGAVLALVAFLLIALLGMAAFAIDINHLYVVRNELQNAADAGALAGAATLYEDPDGAGPKKPGEEVNTDANQVAYDIAVANVSDKTAVDVHWTSGNTGDVQRGHWSFASRTFTPSASTAPTDLWGVSDADLDQMDGTYEYPPGSGLYPVFINAVRVVARRHDTPALAFFAKIFGHDDFLMSADAVAYIGFSGSLGPLEAEQPIVICDDTLTNDSGEYECNVGRMLDSGSSCSPSDPDCDSSINTAGWSDMSVFPDESSCGGASSASDVKGLICQGGANPGEIQGGDYLSATNGVQTSSYNDMKSCWEAASSSGTQPYQMTLPVVDCGSGTSVDNCVRVIGAVTVNMLFMSKNGSTKPEDAPSLMEDPDPDHVEFDDWAYDDGHCGAAAPGGRDFMGLVGLPTFPDPGDPTLVNALDQLNTFPVLDEDGNWVAPGDSDRWMAYPDNPSDQRWHGESSIYTVGMARWDCFVDHFGLINTNGKMAPLANKSMYFMPDCSPHEPEGRTSGTNFGVLAEIPVLVE